MADNETFQQTVSNITEQKASLLKKYLTEFVITSLTTSVLTLAIWTKDLYERIIKIQADNNSFAHEIIIRNNEAYNNAPFYYERFRNDSHNNSRDSNDRISR